MRVIFVLTSLLFLLIGCTSQKQVVSTSTVETNQSSKGKLIYLFDPLCGWCYGFAPVMDKLYQNYRGQLDFEIISGGMITGDRIGPIGEVAPYIKTGYKQVERHTNVQFGDGFLNRVLEPGTAVFSSVPPSIALEVVRDLEPDSTFAYAKALQKAIYNQGIKPMDWDAYATIAEQFGMERTTFREMLDAPKYRQAAEDNFKWSEVLGAEGFPTIVYENTEGERQTLAVGYLDYNQLEMLLLRAID